ncbi:transposase [Fusobacterium sp. DD1]
MDTFHIVQLINRALNKLRITAMNSFKAKNPSLYRKFKRE